MRAASFSLFLVCLLFLASCIGAVSSGNVYGTDSSAAARDLNTPALSAYYGYESSAQEKLESYGASGLEPLVNSSAVAVTDKPEAPSEHSEASSDFSSSNASPSAQPVPVLPEKPSEDVSGAVSNESSDVEPGAVSGPVEIQASVCYEWIQNARNILYIALQLNNVGAACVEITGVNLNLTTAESTLSLTYDEIKTFTNMTKIIEPGQTGYIVVFYPFEPSIGEEGTHFKSVSAQAEHRGVLTVRKGLEIAGMSYRPQAQGTPLKIGFTVTNQTSKDLENFYLEIILLDENDHFIGAYCITISMLGAGEEFSHPSYSTGIYAEFVAGNLNKIQGTAYYCG
ncbi:MAG: hypothetical protein LBQ48_08070 [Oscillospiraceae bacterium]|jgi:hypothetical protein|nr:hypothetical protein [Oscillospiraceae bacterium]